MGGIMGKAQITLTLQQLFIADHGIRERLKRPGISQLDREAEEEALDAINTGIHDILRVERRSNNVKYEEN